jgi:hypothetical protein
LAHTETVTVTGSIPIFREAESLDLSEPFGMEPIRAEILRYIKSGEAVANVQQLVQEYANGRRTDNAIRSLAGWSDNALVLHASQRLVAKVMPADASITATELIETRVSNELFAVIAGGALRFRRYVLTNEQGAIPSIERHGQISISQGECIAFDARSETFLIEEVEGDCLLLHVKSDEIFDISRRYDRKSFEYRQTIASSLANTRLRFALELFTCAPGTRSIEAAALLLRHRSHYVRWAAIEALTLLDRERALSALAEARDDVHPHVRTASIETLRRYEEHDVAVA